MPNEEIRQCMKMGSGGKCRKYFPVKKKVRFGYDDKGRKYGSTKGTQSSLKSREGNSGSNKPRDVKTMPTWKGDPTDTVKIEEWKRSFEPGYKPKIISPRDSKGKYTSDPEKTVGYITMDKETHAREIAIALQSEPKIPMSIVDYLTKTLGAAKTGEPAHTATTLTKTKGEESTGRALTSMTRGKFGAMVIAGLVGIFFLLKLGQTK